jgi:hypothetical protein
VRIGDGEADGYAIGRLGLPGLLLRSLERNNNNIAIQLRKRA